MIITLTDYYADWCEPCKWLDPILTEMKNHFGDRILFEKINVDHSKGLMEELHILSVPTLILRKDGQEVWRKRGFDIAPKMIKEIETAIS